MPGTQRANDGWRLHVQTMGDIWVEVRQTSRFTTWLAVLRDQRARARILKRLDRAKNGNLGDVARWERAPPRCGFFTALSTECISRSGATQ